MTTPLSDSIRSALSDSRTRIDFASALEEMGTLIGEINRSGSLLELQKRSALASVQTAIDVLKNRYDSTAAFGEALESVSEVAHVLPEPDAGALAQWFFHLTYAGRDVTPESTAVAAKIIRRRQPDPKANERKLQLDLDR